MTNKTRTNGNRFARWLTKFYPDVYKSVPSDKIALFGLETWVRENYPSIYKAYSLSKAQINPLPDHHKTRPTTLYLEKGLWAFGKPVPVKRYGRRERKRRL